jgi:ribonucleotide reductase alpha subunit
MSDNLNILSPSFLAKYKNKQPNWGFNGLGYIVYKRTYARLKEDGTTEEWNETVERCINGAQKIGAKYSPEEAERIYDYVFNLKCNFAGRMLWQLGTSTVDRFGANSLLNCWATAMREPKAFLFLFENLMLGGGVGYSIRREDVHELPKIKKSVTVIHEATKDADYIVPDKREGWVNLLSKVLDAFYVTGKSFSYSTILIRGYGEPIKGFGGKASGPQILIDGIDKITKIFQAREGKKLRSIDVLDICNIIGSVVVAGNVRRSAEIALGDPDDILYLRAKNWGSGNVPNWRAMSNNTIYADSYDHVLEEIWKNGYEINKDTGYANGEPYGFFNLPLSQKFGRIKDGPISDNSMYPTDTDNCEMTNPCAEISLSNYECCNLSELYLNNITSKDELIDCAQLLYKTQKAIASLPFIHEETNRIVHKNMRLGLGVTGVCQSLHKLDWLDDCYVALRKFDKDWSAKRGWSESIKLTTIKPSGTLSLLGGATPGVHPAFSQYYMRTVRMSSSDALVQTCKDMGYHVEFLVNFDGTENRDTVVVYFPCKTPEGSILTKDMDVIKQLDMVKKLQTVWSDNAVSVTAYYKPEELDTLKTWLKNNYEHNIKSVSFLLFKDHGFKLHIKKLMKPHISLQVLKLNLSQTSLLVVQKC